MGAMFLTVRGRGNTPCFGEAKDLSFMTFIKTKGVGGHLEFGNGERIKFDWTKTQDCDPGELKGPPKCFCRLWSRGYYISALFSHPRPRARASAPQHSHPQSHIVAAVCRPLVPSLSGIRCLCIPNTVSVKRCNKHLFSEHLVCASQFSKGFMYWHI